MTKKTNPVELSISVNLERNGIEVRRPNRKLSDAEFATLSSLKEYGLVYFKKFECYLNQAYRVDVKKLLSDKSFQITKAPNFDQDYKTVMDYWKKNPATKKTAQTKSATKATKSTAKSAPTVAPQNSAETDLVLGKVLDRLEAIEKHQKDTDTVLRALITKLNLDEE